MLLRPRAVREHRVLQVSMAEMRMTVLVWETTGLSVGCCCCERGCCCRTFLFRNETGRLAAVSGQFPNPVLVQREPKVVIMWENCRFQGPGNPGRFPYGDLNTSAAAFVMVVSGKNPGMGADLKTLVLPLVDAVGRISYRHLC